MFLLLLTLACLHPSSITPLSDTHYLVTDDYNRLYDCDSRPVGGDWRPTCVRVDYSNEVPAWVRSRYEVLGYSDPGVLVDAPNKVEDERRRADKGPGYIILGRRTPPPAEPSADDPKDSP